MLGYHQLEHLSWLDSFLNAAMILGGMGPVNEVHSAAGVLFTPAMHRLLHHFHVEAQTARDRK
jgi:hypothetical protein